MLLAAMSFIFCSAVYFYLGFFFFTASLLLCFGMIVILNKSLLNTALFGLLFLSLLLSVISVNQRINAAKDLNGKKFTARFVVCSETVSKRNKCVSVVSEHNGFIIDGMKFDLYYKGTDFEIGDKITVDVDSIKIEDEKALEKLFVGDSYGRLWLNKTVKNEGHDLFYYTIGKIRRSVKGFFYDNLSYGSYATLTAIMLGDKTGLSQSFYDDVKSAGASHLMAVSGLHLSVVMGLLFLVVERLFKNRYLRFLIICFSIGFICALCSFTPSIVRAGIMFITFAVPPLFKRDADRLSVMCLSVVIMLLSSPLLLFNISFQMSVSAVFAVMLVVPGYTEIIKNKIPLRLSFIYTIVEILGISIFAQLFTAPFSVYTFKTFSVMAPLTNLFVSFAVALALQLGIIAYLIKFLPFISGYLLFLVERLLIYVNRIIESFGEFRYSSFGVHRLFCIIPAVISAVLVAGMYIINRRKDNAL